MVDFRLLVSKTKEAIIIYSLIFSNKFIKFVACFPRLNKSIVSAINSRFVFLVNKLKIIELERVCAHALLPLFLCRQNGLSLPVVRLIAYFTTSMFH